MNRIKKGDTVKIISGKNKGLSGTVLEIMTAKDMAIVEGINIIKVHKKPDNQNENGGIFEKEAPIRLSKIALMDPKQKGSSTKVSYVKNKDGKKVRFAKKSQTELSN
jgi:large subunit ribosomal protein L24